MPRAVDESDEILAVRAAELYYDDGKTQDEVGAILGLTRWKVGRLLASARESGVIRVEIVHPRARRLPVERELRERFGLQDAVVVPTFGTSGEHDLRERVAQAAADYLSALRPVPRRLGISWGRTLHDVANRLNENWAVGVNVVQVNGGVSVNQRAGTASATAVEIARKASGEATILPSPAILERVETKRSIESDRTVAAVLDQAASANMYLFSAGAADHRSAHIQSGYLSAAEMDELVRRGAVGDIWGRYINAEGMIVDPALDERTLGLGLDELRRADGAVLVTSGRAKHAVTRAAVVNGLCTSLVTDEATAADLIESDEDRAEGRNR